MSPIRAKQLDHDLAPTAGVALVRHHPKTLAPTFAAVDAAVPVRTGVATSDIVRGYVGLGWQGESDFGAIENPRGDRFFRRASGVGPLPSGPMQLAVTSQCPAPAYALANRIKNSAGAAAAYSSCSARRLESSMLHQHCSATTQLYHQFMHIKRRFAGRGHAIGIQFRPVPIEGTGSREC